MTVASSAPQIPVPAFRPPFARVDRILRNPLLLRLDDRDRALYLRYVIGESASGAALLFWTALTTMGGVTASVMFALVPLLTAAGLFKVVAAQAAWTLSISLLVGQGVKRVVVRTRPTERVRCNAHVRVPDRFSFPSGHAAASMSIAFIHAATFHSLGWPLLVVAMLIGASRVRLGVHYPGDVVVGQAIAIATGVAVRACW
ncbi:MAG: phosphatase PAP2 family protein [Gemmatimonadales bacterium]